MVRRTTKHNKIKTRKQIVRRIVTWVLIVSVAVFGVWLFKHYAAWVYIKRLFASPTPVSAYTATPAPEQTPEPQVEEAITVQPTATPAPTPYINPGDRDGMFTDGPAVEGDLSYRSSDLAIGIEKVQTDTLTYYVAEVYIRDINNLFSALAGGKFCKGTDITTNLAEDNNAIFAVSGDYYNASGRDTGIIIRNGELYRDKPGEEDIMAIYSDGNIGVYDSGDYTGNEYLQMGVTDTYAFGPKLIKDGQLIQVDDADHSVYVHPRCGVGMIEPYHYIFIVVDGRKPGYSDGITVNDFAKLFESYGCSQAYNLDGGGSATMVFMDKLVNLPQGYKNQRPIGDAIVIREPQEEATTEQPGE